MTLLTQRVMLKLSANSRKVTAWLAQSCEAPKHVYLQRHILCGSEHAPFIGVMDSDKFQTSEAHSFGVRLWDL